MKLKAIFTLSLCFLSFCVLFAQDALKPYNIKIAYELNFQQDSTKSAQKREVMFLFIKDNESLFESANEFYNDSLRHQRESGGKNTKSGNHWSEFQYRIYKSADNQIRVFNAITQDAGDNGYFTYTENKSVLNWQIHQDTATIASFPVQKATVSYGGRNWTAWFTPDIPISEGPYKFCGLPGLIVEISDSENHYNFSLIGIKQEEVDVFAPHTRNPIKTTKKQYFKAVERYKSNPFGYAQQSGIVYTSGQDEIKKNLELFVNQRNNPIELEP